MQRLITSIPENQPSPLNLSIINQAAEAGDREVLEAIGETGAARGGPGCSQFSQYIQSRKDRLGGSLSIWGNPCYLPLKKSLKNERWR